MNRSDSDPVPVRKSRWRRWALVALVVAGCATLIWLRATLDDRVRRLVESRLADAVGGRASFGTFALSLARLELRFTDLELEGGDPTRGHLILGAEAGRLRLAWTGLPLLAAGKVHLADVDVTAPAMDIVGQPWLGGEDTERPLRLRIDRLRVRQGRLRMEETETHADFLARDLSLEGARQGDALVGIAEARVELRRRPDAAPWPLVIASHFRLGPEDLKLTTVDVRGPGLDLDVQTVLILLRDFQVTGRGTAVVDLAQALPYLDVGTACDGGRLEAPFAFELGPEPLSFRSRVRATEVRCAGLRVEGSALARYTPGHLELLDLDTRTLGGEVLGRATVTLADQAGFEAELQAGDVHSLELFRWIGIPLALDSRVDGTISLRGPLSDPNGWRGTGSILARPIGRSGAGVRIPTPATLALDGPRFSLAAGDVEIAAALLDARIDVDRATDGGVVDLRGTTSDARRTQVASLGLLRGLGLTLPGLVEQPLNGRGDVGASVRLGNAPEWRLTLDLTDGDWSGRPFERAGLSIGGNDRELAMERLTFSGDAGELRASGAMNLQTLAPRSLELSAERVDVRLLQELALQDLGVEGRLDAEVRLGGGQADVLEGDARFSLADATWFGQPLELVEVEATVRGSQVLVSCLEARSQAGWIVAEGAADLGTGQGRLQVTGGAVSLEHVALLEGLPVAARGEVALGGAVDVGGGDLDARIEISGDELSVGGYPLGTAAGHLQLDRQGVRGELASLREAGWRVEGRLAWGAVPDYRVTLDLVRTPLDLQLGMIEDAWVVLDGRIEIEGQGFDAMPTTTARVDHAEIHVGVQTLETAGVSSFVVDAGALRATPMRIVGDGVDVELTLAGDLAGGTLDASAAGRLDLALVSAILPEVRSSGPAELDLTVRGPVEAPAFSGTLRGEGGRMRWLGFPQGLEQSRFELRLDGQHVELAELRARLGTGEVRASGEGTLVGASLESFRVQLSGDNVRIRYPTGFRGTYEGDLVLASGADGSSLSGKVRMLRGIYDRPFDLTRVLGFGIREYGSSDDSALPDLELDIQAEAAGGVWVDNRQVRVESSFDLQIGGTLQRPEITGRLWMVEGGRIVFRDVNYTITSGSLDFIELTRMNPYLTLRAEAKIKQYTVLLRIEGTLDRFDYELSSEPALGQQDIIALLTTGQTLEEITDGPGERAFTGDLAANYFAGALTDPLARQIRQLLKVEKVRIDPVVIRGAADPTTRITLGEKVGEDVYVTLSSELGGDNQRYFYEIEWRLTDKIGLTAEQDTQGGVGGSVRYSDRFWWHDAETRTGVPSPERAAPPAREAGAKTVADVEITGLEPAESREVRKRLPEMAGSTFKRSRVLAGAEAIRRHYVERDHLEAVVDWEAVDVDDTSLHLRYHVVPGPRIEIVFEGIGRKEARKLRAELENAWTESIYTDELYDESEAQIREHYRERGFYAVDIRSEVVSSGPDRRRVVYHVDRGKPVRVQAIRLEGNRSVPEERIRQQMLTAPASVFWRKPLQPVTLEEDLAAIRNLYRDMGFLDVKLEPPRIRLTLSGEQATIEITIHEGPRFTIGEVVVPDEGPVEAATLLQWAGLETGAFFSQRKLLEAESRVRSELDRLGHTDARVRGRAHSGEEQVRIVFEIDPGPQLRLGEVVIEGTTLTRNKVVRREIELEPGDLISREKLLKAQHRLYQLGIFRSVQLRYEPMEGEDPSLRRLAVSLVEAPPFATALGLGYDTEADARVDFSLSHQNVGGYDRSAALLGRFDKLNQRLELVTKDPRLFTRRLPTLATLSWSRRKEIGFEEQRRSLALRVDKRFGSRWKGFARYGLDRVELRDVVDEIAVVEEKLENLRLADVSGTLIRSTVDNPFSPARGTRFDVGVSWFARPLLSEASLIKLSASWAGYRRFDNGLGLASAVRLGSAWPVSSTTSVPLSERFFAGGASTLRGFERDELGPRTDSGVPIGGQALLLINQELRFPIWRDLRGVLFYDTGNVFAEMSNVELDAFRHVLGAGLRLETPVGPLRLEYGRKVDREPNESNGEWFLSIGTAF